MKGLRVTKTVKKKKKKSLKEWDRVRIKTNVLKETWHGFNTKSRPQ